jgi:guanylate kinase
LKIIISGPSGAGKTSLIDSLIDKSQNLKLSISYTTRNMRQNEISGREYNFISIHEFQQKIKENFFMEYTEYKGNFYGTSYEELHKEGNWIFNLDAEGVKNFSIKKNDLLKNKSINIITVFIIPPSAEELIKRLQNRNEQCSLRYDYSSDLNNMHLFDYILINDSISRCSKQLENIISLMKEKERAEDIIKNF